MVSVPQCRLSACEQRTSQRSAVVGRKRYSDYEYDEAMSSDDGGGSDTPPGGASPKRFRHSRITTEDRRFGARFPHPAPYIFLGALVSLDSVDRHDVSADCSDTPLSCSRASYYLLPYRMHCASGLA